MRADSEAAAVRRDGGCRSGWAWAWSCMNSWRRARRSMLNGPVGGEPLGMVLGNRS
jgi:hypothetical protein